MKNTLTIAKYTFIEVYRSKIMLGIVFLAIGMLLMTMVASAFAYGAPEKIALDFAVGMMSIANLLIAVFLGVTLISKEIELRTLYMVLSRPISRFAFLVGKIIGLSTVLIINTISLTLIGLLCYKYLGGTGENLLYWVAFFSLMEAIIIMLFGVMFSLISNPSLASVFTILILVSGHTLTSTLSNFFAKASSLTMVILKYSLFFIPDLDRMNLKDFLIYKQQVSNMFLFSNLLYVFIYIGILLSIVSIIFSRKNLD